MRLGTCSYEGGREGREREEEKRGGGEREGDGRKEEGKEKEGKSESHQWLMNSLVMITVQDIEQLSRDRAERSLHGIKG